ncbi:hypothetical protein [Microvirga sp. Mcv34]|uniref:hypothetical protein n=1 Tax=Microvirga sp. Mcv34 TaxID=2926016 RepID=UPI0021C7F540|nr:hypothetical protein [Microvirga sp. Mcv34]
MTDLAERIEAEYMAWFQRLQSLTDHELDPDKWVSRWYDNYNPAAALEAGPEEDEE